MVLHFGPSNEIAETFARSFHDTVVSFGELETPFKMVRREWFLADHGFVTVHVCFQQQERSCRFSC